MDHDKFPLEGRPYPGMKGIEDDFAGNGIYIDVEGVIWKIDGLVLFNYFFGRAWIE
ncbi:hypothetical protein GCM10010913_22700 [Paenibacillus aceti]|uniref:DUF5348 domain-containing protein n=1 Tax=Paenibacillus aceti TaxID=1820010 RepID=A0ABQ1VUT9_9BACL|nr:hypothetical protein GCM10010913_22700 [Paenibacillus aceti]